MGILYRCRHGTLWEQIGPHDYEIISAELGCSCNADEAVEAE